MQKWYETTLFYDSISGKYITSSMDTINRIQNQINYYAWFFGDRYDNAVCYVERVDELRDEIGLPKLPDNIARLCNKPDGSMLDVRFQPVLIYGLQCLVLDFGII